ncbi:MAG: glycoside hydrolase family 2 protein [Treponema sp.]|jgi:beta-mannosidase|nr:glycoside hydrolase family 2 protein [Treponema sp.]
MIKQKLTTAFGGEWRMRNSMDKEELPARVPGSVYADLLANKNMEDPFWRDNEDAAFALMENDWVYTCRFVADAAFFGCRRVLLRCEGLDTLADVFLNGDLLGKADNMHRVWEFDVLPLLKNAKDGENLLTIVFHSPNKAAREAFQKIKTKGSEECLDGFPQLRKAHCMFGWDWGPRLPDAGVWRNIELVGVETARITGVYLTQTHRERDKGETPVVDLHINVEVDRGATVCPYEVIINAPDGGGRTVADSPQIITIENPELWYPNGYGPQPLYTATVVLSSPDEGAPIDVWEGRVGLRTLTVNREADEWGECFAFEVNGIRIFAMGADYIPQDNILSRVTTEKIRGLLEQCVAANFNMVRVWGGGYYPDDFFYDVCDELGLVVWQDFMFACAAYELTDAFEENVRRELADNIKRIRHHACLGLWCGNNELEAFLAHGIWANCKQKADYTKIFEYVIPNIVKEYDPATFYWSSSPSSGGSFDNPQDENRGDVHYWDVWHGNKPFSDYRNHYFRFVSEFGFQSFPCLKTVEAFTLPQDRNPFSYIMERHQRNNAANGKIVSYLSQTYLYPNDFGAFIYASQLLQAEAIKYGVEHFRRNRGRCMGAIYWQLNDCWPVASWASIDYFGEWKALHYFAKRFFAPLLLSCEENGMETQDPNVNAQPHKKAAIKNNFRLCVSNETRYAHSVLVMWEIRDKNAEILREDSRLITVSSISSLWLEEIDVADLNIYDEYVSFRLVEGGETISEGVALFCPPKHFHFVDPRLSFRVKGDFIVVKAEAFAKGVEIQGANILLSDNYFDMDAGEKKVKILHGVPQKIRLRSVFDIGN